jgi:hypothetical protein
MEYTTLLLELDSILDTRLSLLVTKFPDRIDDILKIYFSRATNEFDGIISYEDFNSLYRQRDRSVLKNAVMCKTILLVKDFVDTALENMIQTSVEIPPKLILNIYPYDLSAEEIKLILTSMIFHIGNKVDIEVAYIRHEDILPSKMLNSLWGYLKFDYYNWLDDIGEKFKDNRERCPDTKLITPAYFPVKNKDISKLFTQDGKRIDPFFYFKTGLSYIIDIEFTEKSMFNRMWYIEKPELDNEETTQNP